MITKSSGRSTAKHDAHILHSLRIARKVLEHEPSRAEYRKLHQEGKVPANLRAVERFTKLRLGDGKWETTIQALRDSLAQPATPELVEQNLRTAAEALKQTATTSEYDGLYEEGVVEISRSTIVSVSKKTWRDTHSSLGFSVERLKPSNGKRSKKLQGDEVLPTPQALQDTVKLPKEPGLTTQVGLATDSVHSGSLEEKTISKDGQPALSDTINRELAAAFTTVGNHLFELWKNCQTIAALYRLISAD